MNKKLSAKTMLIITLGFLLLGGLILPPIVASVCFYICAAATIGVWHEERKQKKASR